MDNVRILAVMLFTVGRRRLAAVTAFFLASMADVSIVSGFDIFVDFILFLNDIYTTVYYI